MRYRSRRLGVVKFLLLQLYLGQYACDFGCNCRAYLTAGGVLEVCIKHALQCHVVSHDISEPCI